MFIFNFDFGPRTATGRNKLFFKPDNFSMSTTGTNCYVDATVLSFIIHNDMFQTSAQRNEQMNELEYSCGGPLLHLREAINKYDLKYFSVETKRSEYNLLFFPEHGPRFNSKPKQR